MFRKLYSFYSNRIIKGTILPFYYRLLRTSFKMFGVFAKVSLSQASEDLIIDLILKNGKRSKGVFIDVGCNHPIAYNNTYLLYLRGWRGINIDGNEKLIELYGKYRTGDTNLNYLISNKEEEVVFNISRHDMISTIESAHMDTLGEENFPESQRVKMTTRTLNAVLNQHLSNANQQIDLLCIDVEGHDFEVLSSIDLDKYQPYLIVIEMLDFSFNECLNHRVYKLLTEKGYTLSHFVFCNGYFVKN